jgi:hypothetical protein
MRISLRELRLAAAAVVDSLAAVFADLAANEAGAKINCRRRLSLTSSQSRSAIRTNQTTTPHLQARLRLLCFNVAEALQPLMVVQQLQRGMRTCFWAIVAASS